MIRAKFDLLIKQRVELFENRLNEIIQQIRALTAEEQFIDIQITKIYKEECLKLPKIQGIGEYIRLMRYSTDLYSTQGMDRGEWDEFGDIKIHYVGNYGYTDILGLTDKEFNALNEFLKTCHDENFELEGVL